MDADALAPDQIAMTVSCGLLMYVPAPLRVLLVHPGGPYWRGKDMSAWSVPKGIANPNEEPLAAARREFAEETGLKPKAPFFELKALKQKSGKLVRCWAFEGDPGEELAPGPSTFELEWPPKSGRRVAFPEVGDVQLFEFDEALAKILPGQAPFVLELSERLS